MQLPSCDCERKVKLSLPSLLSQFAGIWMCWLLLEPPSWRTSWKLYMNLVLKTEFSKILGPLYQPWMLKCESNETELNLSWVLDVGLLAFVAKDEP